MKDSIWRCNYENKSSKHCNTCAWNYGVKTTHHRVLKEYAGDGRSKIWVSWGVEQYGKRPCPVTNESVIAWREPE